MSPLMRLSPTLSSPLAALLAASLALPGCSGGGPTAAKPPEWKPENETKCKVLKSQSRPLIVEWPSNDRVALEATMKDGVAMVRANGCEVEVLHRCKAASRYGYRGTSKEADSVSIRNEDDLYANLPLGAASLSGKLQSSGSLNVNMAVVGRYVSEGNSVSTSDVQGEGCERATHFISAVSVGAFSFFAGGSTEAGAGVETKLGPGAGVKTSSSREELKSGGNVASCDKASRKDAEPPEGCGALLRIEIVPLAEGRKVQAPPSCPPGKSWNGSRCASDDSTGPTPTSTATSTSTSGFTRPTPTSTSRPRPTSSPSTTATAPASPLLFYAGYSFVFGGLALTVGGLGALQQKAKIKQGEPGGLCDNDGRCTEEGKSARSVGRAMAITANIGAGLLALGAVLYLVAPKPQKPSASVGITGDGIRLSGEFLAMRAASLLLAFLSLSLVHCEQIIGADFSEPTAIVEKNSSTGGVNPPEPSYKNASEFCQAFAAALCTERLSGNCWPKEECLADTQSKCEARFSGRQGYLNNSYAASCISATTTFGSKTSMDNSAKNSRYESCRRAFGYHSALGGPCFTIEDCADIGDANVYCLASKTAPFSFTCQKTTETAGNQEDCNGRRCTSGFCNTQFPSGVPTCDTSDQKEGEFCSSGPTDAGPSGDVSFREGKGGCASSLLCQEDFKCYPVGAEQTKCGTSPSANDSLCGTFQFCIGGACVPEFSIKSGSSPSSPDPSCQALRDNPLLGTF